MANIYSVHLGGTADGFSAVDGTDFQPTGVFTVGFWGKANSDTGLHTAFQSYSQNTNVAGWNIGINVPSIGPHKATFLIGPNTGTAYGAVVGNTTIDDGVWHWVVGVWDGSNMYLYVDGVSDATPVAWTNAPGYAATNYVRVGCEKYNTSAEAKFWNGNLDETFILNGTAWSSSTVSSFYKQFITGATNLKAYYQFENNANDSADSHTLTAIGSPSYQTDVPFVGGGGGFFAFM